MKKSRIYYAKDPKWNLPQIYKLFLMVLIYIYKKMRFIEEDIFCSVILFCFELIPFGNIVGPHSDYLLSFKKELHSSSCIE